MQKKLIVKNFFCYFMQRKLMSIFGLTNLLLLTLAFNVNAKALSQNATVTLNFEKAKVKRVLAEITRQTSYDFFYDKEILDDNKEIKAKFVNEKLSFVMNSLFGNTYDIKYKSNIVMITPKVIKDKKKDNIIKGKVTDEKGNPLPGVTVVVKGTKIGVATNSIGQFKINCEKGDILVFSFIGMKTKEVKYVGKELKVILKDNVSKLNEVIVNGFKSVKKDHFTGNATVVTKKELLKVNPKSVIAALQVFDPSFRIKENNKWGSDPNALPEFSIRGESSIGMDKGIDVEAMRQNQRTNLRNNPNLPIFVLDGFEVDVETICDLDMHRIKNITILKDATATSLYGSKAANGVILVTTIAPKPGKVRVSYNVTTSLQFPDLSDYNLCSAEEKFKAEDLAGIFTPFGNSNSRLIEKNNKMNLLLQGVNTDWMPQPLRNVYNHKHSVNISGGTDNIRYGIDLRYNKNDGVMKGSYRDGGTVGFSFSYVYKKFKIRNRFSYDNTSSKNSEYGDFSDYSKMQPYYRIYDDDGNLIEHYSESMTLDRNPLFLSTLQNYDGKTKSDKFTDNFDLEYYINDFFRFNTQFSFSKSNKKIESYTDPKDISFFREDKENKGKLSRTYSEDSRVNLKILLNYSRSFNKHFANLVGGFDLSQDKSSSNSMTYRGFEISNLNSPFYAAKQENKTSYAEDVSRTIGFIASFNYSFDNKYLFDGSFRYDGSSKFGSNKRFAPFWSLGTGVNIHKFDFCKKLNFINTFRLRGSYGSLGKINFPSHTAISSHVFNELHWYKTGSVSNLYSLGNPNLKWETTKTLDVGFELGMFNGKINLRASYYNKRTVDLISDMFLRRSSGFEKYKMNSGEIENKGYEVSINSILLRRNNFILSVFGNLSHNKNTITKLSESMMKYNESITKAYDDKPEEYREILSRPFQQYRQGASTTALYAVRSEGIDPCNGKERLIKENGLPTYDWCGNDQVNVGDKSPKVKGSFGINASYKNLYINASFGYSYGAKIYNSTIVSKIESIDVKENNVDRRFLTNRWKKPGDITPFLDIQTRRYSRPTTRLIQNNDFINFSSLCVGYDFKTELVKKVGLEKVGLSLNANDIARWSTVKIERGLSYPFCRNYSLSLNLNF